MARVLIAAEKVKVFWIKGAGAYQHVQVLVLIPGATL
jgi:hypothetical protein